MGSWRMAHLLGYSSQGMLIMRPSTYDGRTATPCYSIAGRIACFTRR